MTVPHTSIAWRRFNGSGTASRRTLGRIQTVTSTTWATAQGRSATGRRPIMPSRTDIHIAQRDGIHTAADRGFRGQRRHVLAPPARLDARGHLAGAASLHSPSTRPAGGNRPDQSDHRFPVGARRFWGPHTGPSPVDRRKNGSKRHIISEAKGLPLLVHTTPGNVRDEQPVVNMIHRLPMIQGPRGRPRKKPGALVGDRGYGFPSTIAAVSAMGILSMLAPRGSEHGSGLGKVRYVIERTMIWFGHWRRLKLCYEKTGSHWQAYHDLAASLICFRRLQKLTRRRF